MLLQIFAQRLELAAAVTLMLERAEPRQIDEDTILAYDQDQFYDAVKLCVGNMPNMKGEYIYPDKSVHREPYKPKGRTATGRVMKDPPMQQDPELDARARKILGDA